MVDTPTILVKKSDGTFVKVPLSELKAKQASAPSSQVSVSAPAPKPAQQLSNRTIEHHKNVVPHHKIDVRPVHHNQKIHVHPAKSLSRADAGSPLEEKLKIKSSAPLFSPKREKQVEEVVAKLGFSVMPEVLGRLKSLILARLKDIKSEDETRELLSRSIKNGGLGLTEQQVEKIIKSCREIEGEESAGDTGAPVLKGNAFSVALHSLESELDLPAPPKDVSPPPFTKRGQGEMPKTTLGSATSATPSSLPLGKGEMTIAKMVNESIANEPVFKLDTRPMMKQSMQDVSASSAEMGPVEEIKSITLVDFRRLSGNPEEAAKRLQQKMFNLQEESFVWYLDALAAYHHSPLYLEYIQAVCQSLAERKSLANVLSMKNSIKLNEVMALVEMEKGL